MRKILLILALILMPFGIFVGCGEEPSISCDISEVSLFQNQDYTFVSSLVDIENYDDGYILKITDEYIATLVGNRIVPRNVGQTKLKVMLKGYEEVFAEVNITIKSGFITEWVSLDKSVVNINMGLESVGENRLSYNVNSTETPTISYDKSLIDYNYKTGVITAKKTGSTIVTIKFLECQTSFEVVVNNSVYTKSMVVDDIVEVFKSTTGKIPFSVFPSSANTYKFWTNSPIISLDFNGNYQAYEAGTAVVYYQYYLDYNSLSPEYSFKIKVVNSAIDYDIRILDNNMMPVGSIFTNKDYKLIIDCDESVDKSLFSISNNINLTSSIEWIEGFGYVINFKFANSGDFKIDVYYNPVSNDASLQLVRSIEGIAYAENDITLGAKWSAYMQYEHSDGKYRIFKDNNSSIADYLVFWLVLGNEIYEVPFDLYLQSGSELILVDKMFVPDALGEYTFVAKIGGRVIDTAVVLVV